MDNKSKFKVQTVGAGIVPMSICPSTGIAHLLLGQERYVRGWSGSHKVSGFEGGNKKNESPERNAARECNEETLGLVYASEDSCSAALFNGKFVMRIAIGSRMNTHVTYLTLVPWIADIGLKFKEIRSFLVELDIIAAQFDAVNHSLRVEVADEEGWSSAGASKTAMAYARSIRTKLEDKLKSSPHGTHSAISVTRDDKRVIQRVKVNTDFLEKIDVQYVPVQSAVDMLHRRRSIIRPFFRPVLAAICANLMYEQSKHCKPIVSRRDQHAKRFVDRCAHGWS